LFEAKAARPGRLFRLSVEQRAIAFTQHVGRDEGVMIFFAWSLESLPRGTLPTFGLFSLAIALLWFGPRRAVFAGLEAWAWVFLAALGSGVAYGVVHVAGLVWIACFAVACAVFGRSPRPNVGKIWLSGLVAAGLAVGFTLHRLPGFANPKVVDAARFTPDALPFTLYFNFDKTLVGLFVIGLCHERIASGRELCHVLLNTTGRAAALIAVVIVISVASGYVRFEPHLAPQAPVWLWANLFFVCLAEEALFRGFLQNVLQDALAKRPGIWGRTIALGVASVAFGLAHAAGGPAYVGLATVAGWGYGWMYQKTGRIEASLLTHFILNTVHFFFFTYPAVAR
jgi:hypothetical protein